MEIVIVIQGCSLNTKIYSLLRYFWNIWIHLFKQKTKYFTDANEWKCDIDTIKKNKYSISQIRFCIKIKYSFSMKTWNIFLWNILICFVKFLLSTIMNHRYSTCALNYRYLINFVTIVSRCPCMESLLCYSIRSTILFNTSRWQFTI